MFSCVNLPPPSCVQVKWHLPLPAWFISIQRILARGTLANCQECVSKWGNFFTWARIASNRISRSLESQKPCGQTNYSRQFLRSKFDKHRNKNEHQKPQQVYFHFRQRLSGGIKNRIRLVTPNSPRKRGHDVNIQQKDNLRSQNNEGTLSVGRYVTFVQMRYADTSQVQALKFRRRWRLRLGEEADSGQWPCRYQGLPATIIRQYAPRDSALHLRWCQSLQIQKSAATVLTFQCGKMAPDRRLFQGVLHVTNMHIHLSTQQLADQASPFICFQFPLIWNVPFWNIWIVQWPHPKWQPDVFAFVNTGWRHQSQVHRK